MSERLKPCPFCGNGAHVRDDDENYRGAGFCVVCDSVDCFAALGEGYDRDAMPEHRFATEEEAIEAWNRRTPESAVTERRCTHCTQQPATTIDEYSDPVCLKCKTEDK
jgi:phage/plasmid primase-like uncharacterized protein